MAVILSYCLIYHEGRGLSLKRGTGKRGNGETGNGKRGNGKRGNGKRGNGKRGIFIMETGIFKMVLSKMPESGFVKDNNI